MIRTYSFEARTEGGSTAIAIVQLDEAKGHTVAEFVIAAHEEGEEILWLLEIPYLELT